MADALIQRGHQITMVCGSGHGETGLGGPFLEGKRRGHVGQIEAHCEPLVRVRDREVVPLHVPFCVHVRVELQIVLLKVVVA